MAASMGKVVKRLANKNFLIVNRNTTWACQTHLRKQSRSMCTDGRDGGEQEHLDGSVNNITDKEPQSFATMLRQSQFVQLGNLKDKILVGRIEEMINNDMYIDFGGKFMCCIQNPSEQPEAFFKGKSVRVCLHKFEMASQFMGSDTAVTLLEAECSLVGGRDKEKR